MGSTTIGPNSSRGLSRVEPEAQKNNTKKASIETEKEKQNWASGFVDRIEEDVGPGGVLLGGVVIGGAVGPQATEPLSTAFAVAAFAGLGYLYVRKHMPAVQAAERHVTATAENSFDEVFGRLRESRKKLQSEVEKLGETAERIQRGLKEAQQGRFKEGDTNAGRNPLDAFLSIIQSHANHTGAREDAPSPKEIKQTDKEASTATDVNAERSQEKNYQYPEWLGNPDDDDAMLGF